MLKFALRLLTFDKKRTLKIIGLVALTLFFPCVLIFSMKNYASFQIQNAYQYGGKWDIQVKGNALSSEEQRKLGLRLAGRENEVYSGRLQGVTLESGEVVYLSLLQCSSPGQLLYLPLLEGRYPQGEGEIVIPYSCSYAGKSPQDGSLKLGDSITVEVGIRSMGDGVPIFSQRIEEGEVFTATGTKTYTIVGFSVYIPLGGIQAVQAVTGMEAQSEANSFYYLSDAKTCEELSEIVRFITAGPAAYNEFLYNAFYENTEMENAAARNQGLLIISAGAFLTCAFICASMLIRTRKERKKQIALLRALGMTEGRRRVLYLWEWAGEVLLGSLGAAGLFYAYTAFLKYILPHMLVSGLSEMQGKFHFGIFAPLILLLFLLGTAAIWREPSEKQSIIRPAHGRKLRTCADLSVIFRKRSRVAKGTVVFMAVVALLALSLGIPLGTGIYQESKRLKKVSVDYDARLSYSADYRDGFVENLLQQEKSVGQFRRRIFAGGKIVLKREDISARVWNFLESSEMYQGMLVNDTLTLSFGMRGCSQHEYEELRKKNPHLPPYEEWCGSQTVLLDDFFIFSDDWSGEETQSNAYAELEHGLVYQEGDTIAYSLSGADEDVLVESKVGQRIEAPVLYKYPQIFAIQIYIPEAWLEQNTAVHVQATYQIQVAQGCELEFNRRLAEWMSRSAALLGEYDYKGIMAANDGIRIQFAVVFGGVFALCALCLAGMYTMLRVDLEYQTKQFAIFRGLGMSRAQTVNIRITERMNLLLNAILIVMAGNLLLYYGVLADYMDAYGITPRNIFSCYVLASLLLVCLGVGDSIALTYQQYRREVAQAQRQE